MMQTLTDFNLGFRQRQMKTVRQIFYVFGLLTSLFSITGVFYVVLTSDKKVFVYNYYESLRSLFTTPFLHLITLTTYFLMTIYNTLSDLVPIFVYYHAALHLTSIGEDILQTSFENSDNSKTNTISGSTSSSSALHPPRFCNIYAAWQRYDRVRHLVERADDLFGLIVLINLGMKLFSVCIITYSILKKNRLTGLSVSMNDRQDRDWENLYLNILVTNLVIFLSRLILLVFGLC